MEPKPRATPVTAWAVVNSLGNINAASCNTIKSEVMGTLDVLQGFTGRSGYRIARVRIEEIEESPDA